MLVHPHNLAHRLLLRVLARPALMASRTKPILNLMQLFGSEGILRLKTL